MLLLSCCQKALFSLHFVGGGGVQKYKKGLFSICFATFRTSLFEKHYAAKRVGVKKGIGSPGRGKLIFPIRNI